MCGLGFYWHSDILKSAAHGWVFKTITWDWSLTPLSVVGLVYSPATCPAHLNPGIPGLFSSKVKDTGVIYTITIWKIISFKYFCYNLSLEFNFFQSYRQKKTQKKVMTSYLPLPPFQPLRVPLWERHWPRALYWSGWTVTTPAPGSRGESSESSVLTLKALSQRNSITEKFLILIQVE